MSDVSVIAEIITDLWPHRNSTAAAEEIIARYSIGKPAINAAHLERQREFSLRTFGPGHRTAGVLDHIAKELEEIRKSPHDLTEWADVIILALDGAWRTGAEPQAILDAIVAKQTKNEARDWPDWRTQDPDKAIEHDRDAADPDDCPKFEQHRWLFDGDDPYIICACGQRRDAITGAVLGGAL